MKSKHPKEVLSGIGAVEGCLKKLKNSMTLEEEVQLVEAALEHVRKTREALVADNHAAEAAKAGKGVTTDEVVVLLPHASEQPPLSSSGGGTKRQKVGGSSSPCKASKTDRKASDIPKTIESLTPVSPKSKSPALALKQTGAPSAGPSRSASEFAAKLGESIDWVLCVGVKNQKAKKGYRWLRDVDNESNVELQVAEEDVRALNSRKKKRSKGEVVMAIYPATTTFYKATILRGSPQQTKGGESTVQVHFFEDPPTQTYEVVMRQIFECET